MTLAHQTADVGIATSRIYRGDREACCPLDQLDTPEGERLVGADKEGVGPIARKTCESCIDFTAVAGVEDLDLQAHGAGGGFDASYCGLDVHRVGRIDEDGNTSGCGHQLAQEFQALCRQLDREKIDPRQVSARPGEAGDQPELERVGSDEEDDRDRRG